MGTLAEWKCHKIVKAGKVLYHPHGGTEVVVECVDGKALRVAIPPGAFTRGMPKVGDYVVVYDDGYTSWSPAKAFESGYTRI